MSAQNLTTESPLVIWQVTDGKPGHENQCNGLIQAMERQVAVEVIQIPLATYQVSWAKYFLRAYSFDPTLPTPDMVLGAGSQTHPTILAAAQATQAASVVLMSPPKILQNCFTYCVVPEHDSRIGRNVITTKGALNTVLRGGTQAREVGLLLIGGPSKHHDWDATALLNQVTTLSAQPGIEQWHLTTSRRTPASTIEALQAMASSKLKIHPHTETPPGWVPEYLAKSGTVWVTEDSVSMVYEAITSGARVGLIEVPRKHSNSRVLRGIDQLVEEGFALDFTSASKHHFKLPAPKTLNEATRVAKLLLDRIFR